MADASEIARERELAALTAPFLLVTGDAPLLGMLLRIAAWLIWAGVLGFVLNGLAFGVAPGQHTPFLVAAGLALLMAPLAVLAGW